MSDSQPLIAQVIHASKWSALCELASKAITPLVFIILARLLTPQDFGIVAAATIVISFSQIFWDAGLSQALIQRQGELEKAANVVFWTNAVLGILIYVLLFILSYPIALLFNDIRIAPVLQVLGIQLIVNSLATVHTALCEKELDFKRLFWVRLLTTLLPAAASVPLAYYSMGYWALVAGNLTGAVGQLVVLWWLSPWRPRLLYDRSVARELLLFGIWASASGLLAWGYLWVDSLVIGAYLGSHDLGLYRTGNVLIKEIFTLLIVPITPVLFSVFSKIQTDFTRLRQAVLNATKLIAIIALPASFGLFAIKDAVGQVVFGDQWIGVGLVIGITGLIEGISWPANANLEAYRAMGRPDLETKLLLIAFIPFLLVYLLAAQYGLEFFLWARLGVAIIVLPIDFYVATIYLKITTRDYFTLLNRTLIACFAMFFFSFGLMGFLFNGVSAGPVELLSVIVISAFLYTTLLFFLERDYVLEIKAFLQKSRIVNEIPGS